MQNENEGSRHYTQIWEKIITPTLQVVREECDEDFRNSCDLEIKEIEKWKKTLEEKYRTLRSKLKDVCYGDSKDVALLDGRKIAAIFCRALIEEKAYRFDTDRAYEIMSNKKRTLSKVGFNRWAVDNVYINYKVAYYVSLQLVYFTLLHDLVSSKRSELARSLNEVGHLYRYPYPSDSDSFDINIIIGLARMDLAGEDLDMFLFAMQLYQTEMYTISKLERESVNND